MRARWLAVSVLGAALTLTGCGPQDLSQAPAEPTASAPPTPTPIFAPVENQAPAAAPTPTPTLAPPPPTEALVAASAEPDLSTVDVVAEVQPAVVTVINRQLVGNNLNQQLQEASRGTGFIIDPEGHIVTNEHVVRGGDDFEVILSDGSLRQAKLIGADPLSDLAVVQMSGDVPAWVAFGDSDQLRVGQPVLAIGSPLGEFTGTVTNGIVSALNRDFPGAAAQGEPAYSNLIQHNAAINPGNSGGPLFDLHGRVIGVNTLGIPETPAGVPAQGLFFAIPSNTVVSITRQLIESGHVSYPYLGIQYTEISPELASVYSLPANYGAYVQAVVPGGPADKAGLQQGDIIVALGGRTIDAKTNFTEALFAAHPGETIAVDYLRGSQKGTAQVTLQERQGQ
ncbi:MAG: trypsin-like peptidase domain-containing protein [Thermomicrobiales bacterium]|nr:trypsin-like peptidase domain-containing protein [Thermomicrobiales bacterium]